MGRVTALTSVYKNTLPPYELYSIYLVSGIYRNLTLHVNMKSQPGINSQTQAKSLFETMTGQHALLRKRKNCQLHNMVITRV